LAFEEERSTSATQLLSGGAGSLKCIGFVTRNFRTELKKNDGWFLSGYVPAFSLKAG
jgi:hypothetical protein